ncbi:permease [Lichenibacterium dinghuense]|uniref:permease n=1 Tax=Lichenibacterium dinghuense TaxID=2895977 RepID=UPI001F21B1F9|nr:permease [Lichenibacterium sp. 6Y81]
MSYLHQIGHALLMSLGMMWQTGWTLVLGFTVSALLQTVVPADKMREALGRGGAKDIAAATALGAASSSCSYASAAIMRTLFKKGAALSTSLAFMFASTNLVLELGIILYVLMGWQFTAGEWIGGVVLVAVMSLLLKLVYPEALIEEARRHEEAGSGHHHMSMTVEGDTWWERLRKPETRVRIAQNFAMEWSMLWKDLLIGFAVGGFLAAFVPDAWWKAMFLQDASPWIKVPFDGLIGPVVACLTFVCSIGNVPLAAVLWAGGASFGGVLAFLYADLLVLPLLDVYRRYFGWRMAAFMAGLFFATMALSAVVMDLAFTALGLVPSHDVDVRARLTTFSLNYTFWLDLAFGALAVYLFWVNRQHPMDHGHQGHQGHDASRDGHRRGTAPARA